MQMRCERTELLRKKTGEDGRKERGNGGVECIKMSKTQNKRDRTTQINHLFMRDILNIYMGSSCCAAWTNKKVCEWPRRPATMED